MKTSIMLPAMAAVLAIAACAPSRLSDAEAGHRGAVAYLKQATRKTLSPEERAALYLSSAAQSARLLDSPEAGTSARETYNSSAADLTVLLRSADGGRLWNKPLTVSSGGTTWRLRFAKPTRDGVWDPARFTSIVPASEVGMKHLDKRNRRDGIGGALVGVRKLDPPEPFAPPLAGVNAPVTAVLDFKGQDVTLSLLDPADKMNASVAGKSRVLEGDFSAPLAHYPKGSEVWDGLMGAIHVSAYMKNTGLYMLQPYDPDRIPLIFVHGLISTPRMWRNVVNEVESDPELRGKYQCWVFSYPTGNPPAYSALRFREELDRVYQLYPAAKEYVLVGHSMGGLISHMQVTTLTRESWNAIGEKKAVTFFSGVKKGDIVDRATIFRANPHIGRVIFICTPHRGSEMALGSLGMIGMRLIALPVDLTATVTGTLGNSLAEITGVAGRLPNSVTGLSPKNPTLKVLDSEPITAPHHSIIGDRGKGDTPNSSDGVVPYWSSHLDSAKSEKIVPGPHGACEMPETITELRRLLLLHLKGSR